MKTEFKIKVKDIDAFVREQQIIYASGEGKMFCVSLHAAPSHPRYIIKTKEFVKAFTNRGEAVRYFNELKAE